MAITPKYDNDFITLGYLNKKLNTEAETTDKKIGEIPKSYNAPPTPPYYANSMLLLNGQIYKCIKSRLVGSFNMSDWKLVVSTNEIDEALKTIFDVNKLEYVEQKDGVIETFYQNDDPSLQWETDIEKSNHVSDLWTTDTLTCYQYVQEATNPITYGWKKRTVPSTLFDVFDGYKKIYLQAPTNYSKDDLWFGETTKVALESSEEFNIEHWEERDDFVESSIIQQEEYHVVYLLPKITEINRQSIAEIKKAIDAITLTVSQTYITQTEVEKYVDGVKTDIAEEYITKEESTAQLEITAKSITGVVEENVERIDGDISEQNKKISRTLQTVDEINAKLNNVADITTSGETDYATLDLNNINESEPIYLKIRPVGTNISYLYPRDNLYPSDTLFMTSRTLRFYNKTTQEIIDYELPTDLLYYDENNYDDLIFDYETRTVIVNKKVGYNADGSTYLLETNTAVSYPFPTLKLKDGDYTISLPGYSTGYIFARLMTQNIYTTQFATRAEVNSEITAKADEINIGVDKKLTKYSTTEQMNAAINVKSEAINIEVGKKVNKTDYTGANIMLLVNNDTSGALINASKIKIVANDILTILAGNTIDLTSKNIRISSNNFSVDTSGLLKATNAEISGKITATSGSIGGCNIENGILQIANANIDSLSVSKISSGTNANDLTFNGEIKCSNIVATGGNIGGCSIVDGVLKIESANITGTLTGKTIKGGDISGVSISGSSLTCGSVYNMTSAGHFKYYNGVGFISCGRASSTSHPWLSAVNVNQSNGISFRTGTTWSAAGSEVARLHASSGYLETTTGFRVNGNINVTGNITGSSGTSGVYLTLTDSNLKINGYSGITGIFRYQTTLTDARAFEFKHGILISEYDT